MKALTHLRIHNGYCIIHDDISMVSMIAVHSIQLELFQHNERRNVVSLNFFQNSFQIQPRQVTTRLWRHS